MWERYLPKVVGFCVTFLEFALLMTLIGIPAFFIGQALPRRLFKYRAFPFKAFKWEKNGRVYQKMKIQYWKDSMPDMSKWVRSAFRKKLNATAYRDPRYVEVLIEETCVAEFVHVLLILLSPIFCFVMGGMIGVVCALAYILGNIPFIMIQRYNRPRLVTLLDKQKALVSQPANGALQWTMTR